MSAVAGIARGPDDGAMALRVRDPDAGRRGSGAASGTFDVPEALPTRDLAACYDPWGRRVRDPGSRGVWLIVPRIGAGGDVARVPALLPGTKDDLSTGRLTPGLRRTVGHRVVEYQQHSCPVVPGEPAL